VDIFQFVKNAGKKISDIGAHVKEINEQIKEKLGDAVQDLEVYFLEGKVKLTGTCTNHSIKEKAVLLAGNVSGVETVDAAELTVQAAEAEEESQFHTVQSGDTLGKIASLYLGKASKYMAIFEANKEILKSPDAIYPGQVLRIPKKA